MNPNLFAYSTSGRLFDSGGERLHIFDWTTGRVLCGRHLVGSCVAEVTPEWIRDTAEGCVCRQCLRKARKMLQQSVESDI